MDELITVHHFTRLQKVPYKKAKYTLIKFVIQKCYHKITVTGMYVRKVIDILGLKLSWKDKTPVFDPTQSPLLPGQSYEMIMNPTLLEDKHRLGSMETQPIILVMCFKQFA
ncbi:hypothetical protein RF11_06240 [Thelohanellus kitauei]|uniref:Uncharacterized protein n=1 Tax=Thelohanellus kitauei TaxID=669202 RepID=A0A0C2J3P9_THEKT|nr:hypothetical protein RF11_06240 [Thelohanellus kitauei]